MKDINPAGVINSKTLPGIKASIRHGKALFMANFPGIKKTRIPAGIINGKTVQCIKVSQNRVEINFVKHAVTGLHIINTGSFGILQNHKPGAPIYLKKEGRFSPDTFTV